MVVRTDFQRWDFDSCDKAKAADWDEVGTDSIKHFPSDGKRIIFHLVLELTTELIKSKSHVTLHIHWFGLCDQIVTIHSIS